jgi:uncharacterized SAM-binding protein YcdF (DUF218 family)
VTTPLSQGESNRLSAIRKAASAIFTGGALVSAAFLIGFAGFAVSLPREEFAIPIQAEGVVALTGGSDRVLDAATLLASGQARRMLITGVNRATRSAVIAKILPVSRQLFDCCVDLGYQALDTAGNAKETRAWARQHNITRTLIVVTSNYHMPRALVEISAALPDVELYPFPVVSENIDVADWVSNLRVARFIGKEYVKYLGSLLRTKVLREFEDSEPPPLLRHSVASAAHDPD